MNFELSMQLSKEKVQNWQSQAALEGQVKAAKSFFKLPKLALPRLRPAARKPA